MFACKWEKSTVYFFLITILFKIIYEGLYVTVLFDRYDYYYANLEIVMMDMNIVKCIISYALYFVLIVALPKNSTRPSAQLVQMYFVTAIMPMLSYFWLANASMVYTLYYVLCFGALSILIRVAPDKPIRLIRFKRVLPIENMIMGLLPILLLLFSLSNTFPNLGLIDISTVYDYRESYAFSTLWSYLVQWMGAVLIPFCMIVFFVKKKYLLVLLTVFMEVYLYFCTGNKIFLFFNILVVVLVVLLAIKTWKALMPLFYLCTVTLTCLFFVFLGKDSFMAITPQRQMALPAALSYKYYDYFSLNPKFGYADGTLGKALDLPAQYDMSIGQIIGKPTGAGTNAVSGFLGDAFGNGGVLAMLLSTALLAGVFLFVDGISKGSPSRYLYTGIMLYPMIVLVDCSLLTELLFGGLLLSLLLMYWFASQEKSMECVDKSGKGNIESGRYFGRPMFRFIRKIE